MAFLDRNKFNRIVRKYCGDRYVKHFTCWNQLLAMMFGQLCNRSSLRDLITILEAHSLKCYHMGMGRNVSKTNLAYANQNRDCRIFEEYAYFLIEEARKRRKNDIFNLGGNVYAFDSTTVDLCLSVFWWAKFRKRKGGVKIHTLYEVETQIPAFVHITTASVHDCKAMSEIPNDSIGYIEDDDIIYVWKTEVFDDEFDNKTQIVGPLDPGRYRLAGNVVAKETDFEYYTE